MEQSNEKIKMLVYHLEEDEKIPTEKWDIIPGKLYEIGRSKKETDLPLDIKLLSRKHAELIYYNNKKILIKDLNSRNGTYLNKIRLEPLQDVYFTTNDILSFGNASNKIVFLSSREEKKRKDSELDRTEKIKKKSYDDENYEKREKNSYSKNNDYKYKYYNKNETYSYRNTASIHRSNKSFSNLRKERSRSREQYREKYPYFKKLDSSPEINNEKEYKRRDYEYERRKNTDSYRNIPKTTNSRFIDSKEEYPKRETFEENERYSMYRKGKRSKSRENEDEESGKEKFDSELKKIQKQIDENKNMGKKGFIKCYVSGYMKLKLPDWILGKLSKNK